MINVRLTGILGDDDKLNAILQEGNISFEVFEKVIRYIDKKYLRKDDDCYLVGDFTTDKVIIRKNKRKKEIFTVHLALTTRLEHASFEFTSYKILSSIFKN